MSATEWKKQRDSFLAAKENERNVARQRAALQILCGVDLNAIAMQDEESRAHMCRRLKRLIERERLKGAKGHWSYDLNRHIGLKQTLDSLRSPQPEMASVSGGDGIK
ncbi:cytoplasmic protein [Phyllobacterium lublinensis]|jgi:hypothetical protein|uniref:cytoplasmic protein n=1 Tax=Phyllobacterium lublinensis TaxID=2875708 RepID=UPI001CCFE870|nr:cytoplasmic protein [Phyllobacterium sp. 2063]MBZ9654334.1 cytoplasmic protein [Phyllobacterium sp. 2063]